MTIKMINNKLKKVLNSNEVLQLLPECGWVDGGCYTLLKILQSYLGEEYCKAYTITDDKNMIHHVFIQIADRYYIDGDGISSYYTLKNRWLNDEGLKQVNINRLKDMSIITLPCFESIVPVIINILNNTIDKNDILRAFKLL